MYEKMNKQQTLDTILITKTVREIRYAKDLLVNEIKQSIVDFEQSTGLLVQEIEVTSMLERIEVKVKTSQII
jgi:hypothetical protein